LCTVLISCLFLWNLHLIFKIRASFFLLSLHFGFPILELTSNLASILFLQDNHSLELILTDMGKGTSLKLHSDPSDIKC